VTKAKSLGKDQTKKMNNFAKAVERRRHGKCCREVKNTEDGVPLKGKRIVTPPL
jgi:hypothetical protein